MASLGQAEEIEGALFRTLELLRRKTVGQAEEIEGAKDSEVRPMSRQGA